MLQDASDKSRYAYYSCAASACLQQYLPLLPACKIIIDIKPVIIFIF